MAAITMLLLILVIVALVIVAEVKRRVLALERDMALLTQTVASLQQAQRQAAQSARSAAETGESASSPGVSGFDIAASARKPIAHPPAGIAAANASPPVSPLSESVPVTSTPWLEQARMPPASSLFPPPPPRPNVLETAMRALRRWFTSGNVPVKIGMLVLFAGVASLLKYANDQGWLRMPIELRLAGVALAAIAGLVLGWRKRKANPTFAVAMQGGMIGILLLVVYAAARQYALMPSGAAFVLSIALIAGLGALAVLQDSRTLAVLGVLAGFLAPIWLSDGSGNHVALFSYYAVLNLAIFAVAFYRSWRVLNLLGFVFTWGIGLAWGVLQYRPEFLHSAQAFLWLFFAIYLALPILYARRRPARLRDRIDACLLFGTPLIAFSLQSGLVPNQPLRLGLYAVVLAGIYAALAAWLRRDARTQTVAQAHALLAVAFATLAVPLALSARVTAAIFALEGAGMVWLGLRQHRRLPLWTGIGLQAAAALAYYAGTGFRTATDTIAIANAPFMSGLLITAGAWASALFSYRAGKTRLAAFLYAWGILWWLSNGLSEIDTFVAHNAVADGALILFALTGCMAAEAFVRTQARAVAWTAVVAFAMGIPMALLQMDQHVQPFAKWGAAAWAVYAVFGVAGLLRLRSSGSAIAAWAQWVWCLVWPTAISLFMHSLADKFGLAEGWDMAATALPWLLAMAAVLHRPHWLSKPLGETFATHLPYLRQAYVLVLAGGWLSTLALPGSAAPLPWIPVLNPLELTQLAAMALVFALWRSRTQALAKDLPLMGVVAFVWITTVTLRATHFLGGAPWSADMFSSSLVQTGLTVVWSVLGVAAWIAGSRHGQRLLWLAGALLMGAVLLKLILVDRQHLGNLLGIGSFIAYGLLCTVVGYFAPAPPRQGEREQEALA